MSECLSITVLNQIPAVDEAEIERLLQLELEKSRTKFVVLDDDPTGVQTVHDISVYTNWSDASIKNAFSESNRLFYILTNSRAMTPEQTSKIHREIAETVSKAAGKTGQSYQFISRSDSTLRGHYPLETELLKDLVKEYDHVEIDGEILCFFFKEGGRFTLGNVHYVREGSQLVPAGDTEFAKDKTFGYQSSDLRDYVEEKNSGNYLAKDVVCISLDMLRRCDFDAIEKQLMSVSHFNKVVVNAVDYCDLKVFCIALFRAMAKGKTFLFRSAASLVKVMGGIGERPLLKKAEMITEPSGHGGIVVVGSHTQKTTAQLEELLALDETEGIEFHSDLVLEGDEVFEAEIERVVAESERVIRSGRTAVCYTNRRLLAAENDTKEAALSRSVKISDGVQALVGRLAVTPSFVVAKGGITSSDVGTKALAVQRADVMGQIKPGIPVWKTDETSKFPHIPYIIFPGNVGEASTLKEAVEELIKG